MPGRPHKIRNALRSARSKLRNFFSRRIGSGEKKEKIQSPDDSAPNLYGAEAQRVHKTKKEPPLEPEPA